MNTNNFSKHLLTWYDQNGRKDLPWRQDITPYRVWVSEIMLQQTQVKTVLSYFLRFIERFPTLPDLAQATEDEVLHYWTGLGYYSRARYLHYTAQKIVSEYAGQFPSDLESLQTLPGIGRSTAGAILSIAFGIATPILDGNVRRILTRYHVIEGLPSSTQLNQKLWQLAEAYTTVNRCGDYTQAIMDLGARICTRNKPACTICPVKTSCKAYNQGKVTEFPAPKPYKKTPVRSVRMLIFHHSKTNEVLLEKRPPLGIWGGLWSFPECSEEEDLQAHIVKYAAKVKQTEQWPTFKHVFTHFQLLITPVYIEVSKLVLPMLISETSRQTWYPLNSQDPLGFAAPVKKLLQQVLS